MAKPQHTAYSISWIQNISDIDRDAWDAMAKPLPTPFLEWDWLRLMEISGSTTAKTGWLPHHLTVRRGSDLIAAAPLYIKGHSAGEFVFDHVWADVARRMGIEYYPKIVGMSPFTPMFGYRFLIAPGEDVPYLTSAMMAEIDRLCRRYHLSGSSFLFVDPQWHREMLALGYSGWQHQSYAWLNHGYKSFNDYLAIFNSNQRRNIKRERNALDKQNISLRTFTGNDIPSTFLPLMYRFYEDTNDKFGPWGCRYLTEAFFRGLYDRYRHRLLFFAAYNKKESSQPLGMSMLVTKGKQLYGRYWGSTRRFNSLHFNACYYSPIEWAIANGINRFDPGAGGAHKIRRGFSAVSSFSLHRFSDPRMLQIMQNHIDEINRLEQEQIDALNYQLPYSQQQLKN
ncbi:MAG: GNAT family N-acetyltransferase [Desulfobacterales bacterium]|jgi:predicted N-acyltransferase